MRVVRYSNSNIVTPEPSQYGGEGGTVSGKVGGEIMSPSPVRTV